MPVFAVGRMVRKVGLEPTQPFGYRLLRPARLPIPPLSRADQPIKPSTAGQVNRPVPPHQRESPAGRRPWRVRPARPVGPIDPVNVVRPVAQELNLRVVDERDQRIDIRTRRRGLHLLPDVLFAKLLGADRRQADVEVREPLADDVLAGIERAGVLTLTLLRQGQSPMCRRRASRTRKQ